MSGGASGSLLATEDVQRARQRWLTDRPVGLAYPQVVADDRHQQLKPFGTGQDLGGQSTVARELPGQLTIVGEVQIVTGVRADEARDTPQR